MQPMSDYSHEIIYFLFQVSVDNMASVFTNIWLLGHLFKMSECTMNFILVNKTIMIWKSICKHLI